MLTDNYHGPLGFLASWQLATEFVRRHPAHLIVEMHPGGGPYDCLSVMDERLSEAFSINRVGSLHFPTHSPTTERMRDLWKRYALGRDLTLILDSIECQAGLKKPRALPKTTPRVLTYRFICAWLRAHFLTAKEADCRMGFEDSSGDVGDPVRKHLFEPFPAAQKALRDMQRDKADPAYHFWFVLLGGQPVAALSDDGTLYSRRGEPIKLEPHYQGSKGSMARVLARLPLDLP